MENITQKFWHMQNGPECGVQKSHTGRWIKENITELCLCTAECTESRHQQQGKNIQISQQCCPRVDMLPEKKNNTNCWLGYCLEFLMLLPDICFLFCTEKQDLLYIQDCIKSAGIHRCFLFLTDRTCFPLISWLIRRNRTNAYGSVNNLKLFLLIAKGLPTNMS